MKSKSRNKTNGVSAPSIGMSRMLLGGSPTTTLGVTEWGVTHILHAAELREWTNRYGVRFTDWKTPCGKTGTATGHRSIGTCTGIISIDFAHARMLCPDCCGEVE